MQVFNCCFVSPWALCSFVRSFIHTTFLLFSHLFILSEQRHSCRGLQRILLDTQYVYREWCYARCRRGKRCISWCRFVFRHFTVTLSERGLSPCQRSNEKSQILSVGCLRAYLSGNYFSTYLYIFVYIYTFILLRTIYRLSRVNIVELNIVEKMMITDKM